MSITVQDSILSVNRAKSAFCKFISANDAGKTGGHQAGFYIPKGAFKLIFDKPGEKGENKDKYVRIKWQNDFETDSRFIYYGKGTRNEYRLTRFGREFPYLTDENVGNLFILCHIEKEYYEGFVLNTDDDIEEFLSAFNINPNETNRLIEKDFIIDVEDKLVDCFKKYIDSLSIDFPPTHELALNARQCYNYVYNISTDIIRSDPDTQLLKWIETEYSLFRTFEEDRYAKRIKTAFPNIEELLVFANTILNRRKSRAGWSLEHHLIEIFKVFPIRFVCQAITEGRKKADFIFPDIKAYRNPKFDESKLIFLASKTTCKDRWRQVLNEADRIKIKHLFTLQPGISKHQLEEMYTYGVCLVVPKQNILTFPEEYRGEILTLEKFMQFVASTQ